jgi:hypothetical protein
MPQPDLSTFETSQDPEPSPRPPLLFIGRNGRGQWVVRDLHGLRGGLFVSHAEATRFAMFESGRCSQAIIMVPGLLELDMSANGKMAANGEALKDREGISDVTPEWRLAS